MKQVTTLSSASAVPFRQNRFLQRLLIAFAAWMLYTALRPDRTFDFWLENAAAIAFLAILAATYRRLCLSDASYALIFVFLCLHEWGAQHKYTTVPLGEWLKPLLDTSRNHYDRIMHFGYGLLLSYPMQEWFVRCARVRGGFRYFLPVQFTVACSAVYELAEALMANILSPTRGEEFVGMQGDLWDSQKDIALAAAGSLAAMLLLAGWRARRATLAEQSRGTYAGRSALTGK
jgi:putative membrane protein